MQFSWKKKNNMVCCMKNIIGSVTTSNGMSSVLTEISAVPITVKKDHGSTLLDEDSVALSPNGKAQEEIAVKGLESYVGTTASMEGIGIVKFLKGKRLLITGATGFVAKVLIEKILRTEPDVGKIFLLIKAKSKEAAMERLKNEIIDTELFKCLKQIHGNSFQAFMLSKLVPVVGNVCEQNLGMEINLIDEITSQIDIIVNSAASTTFDERYDLALDINTRGPLHLMSFAKRCTQLKLFLQVSTAYVNGERQGRLLEKPFSLGDSIAKEKTTSDCCPTKHLPMLDIEAEIKLAVNTKEEASQDDVVAQKMKELGLARARIYGWQDTYVFTKAMGEMVIDNMRDQIPVVIMRPSVIESTCREPFPGWMEGNRMMDPIILSYGKGQLTGFLVDPEGVLDVVPADMVVNAILAAMAKHGAAGEPGMNIYQIASSVVNPLVFQDLAKLLFEHFKSSPCIDSKGEPINVPKMKLFSSIDDFSSHMLTDTIQRLGRGSSASHEELSKRHEVVRRKSVEKSVEQAKYLANIYEPYTFYGGRFDNMNTQKLMEDMSEEEKKSFGFDVGSIDWNDYISNVHIPGLRKHVMKGRGMMS
ncbi:Fatty acyl-coa reductase [Thalictrum thalictroides]|uniref:Fatty acyl-CoA reductase n=1 Tax=Thalictrum thalictroides TaxID=46969 RepID=A0A7J6XBS9_THATH|nr:Fatty acyl-coa reductase [Thalictrum thalictroides]